MGVQSIWIEAFGNVLLQGGNQGFNDFHSPSLMRDPFLRNSIAYKLLTHEKRGAQSSLIVGKIATPLEFWNESFPLDERQEARHHADTFFNGVKA